MGNLALLYHSAGRYEDAEKLYRRALEIREDTIGRNDREVALYLNNLGRLLYDTGRPEEAEPLFRRALEINEALLARMIPTSRPTWRTWGPLL